MKHTKVILDPMYGGCGGVILAKCENCTNKLPSCYEEDCGVQNDANAALAKYEAITHDKDGNEVISLARLRELAEAERDGRVVVLPCKRGTTFFAVNKDRGYIYEQVYDYPEVILMENQRDGKRGNRGYTFLDKGKKTKIYLSRAEAERALSGAGEGAE